MASVLSDTQVRRFREEGYCGPVRALTPPETPPWRRVADVAARGSEQRLTGTSGHID